MRGASSGAAAHKTKKNHPQIIDTMAGARTAPNGDAAFVSVPSLREGDLFVTTSLSAKSGATFQNGAALDAVSEPDQNRDEIFWTDPHSATKDLPHPTEDSLDDDDVKEEEERAAGSSLKITLNGHDVPCESTKTPHFFETQADENITESKEIECTGFQRSSSCPDYNESLALNVAPIKRSHSYPDNVFLEQEQGKIIRQASPLGPTHSDEVIAINNVNLKKSQSSLYGKFLYAAYIIISFKHHDYSCIIGLNKCSDHLQVPNINGKTVKLYECVISLICCSHE